MGGARRGIRVGWAGRALAAAVLAAAGVLAPACSTVARPEAIRAADAHEGLGVTPLALMIVGDSRVGLGSGVLAHPRVVLTAAHVADHEPHHVFAHGPPSEPLEIGGARIQRIVSGGGAAAVAGDCALLVLEQPVEGPDAEPAALPQTAPALAPGDAVTIAGFPADGELPGRQPILLRSVCINPPAGASTEPGTVFVRGARGQPDHAGLSGAPVLLTAPGAEPVLAGVYLGSLERRFVGVFLGQEMVVHLLPLEEMRRVIAEVEADDSGV